MKTQWQCIQQNIGTWHGSFTKFSAKGEQLKDTPSVLTLEETEADKTMQLTLERTPADGATDITKRSFSAPGPAPYVYFFETGAFSQGSSQWTSFGQFGAEMSLKVADRRVRFVIMYSSTVEGNSEIEYVTLIRETQKGGTQFTAADTTPSQLIGEWKGEISMLYATMAPQAEGTSRWSFEGKVLECSDTVGEDSKALFLESSSDADLHSNEPLLLNGGLNYQLMPLPNGAYCLIPHVIKKGVEFRIEVGWLRESGERSRLIRCYDSHGVWTETVLVEDYRERSAIT